ncbi:hypothetical protein Tco_0547899 [Tanacetum coccineum]
MTQETSLNRSRRSLCLKMSPSTSDRHLIELENQVQRLMEAHLAHKSHVQVNKIASSCEIFSGPHDTQYCIENSEQAFVDYASSCTDEAGGKWFTFKPEQNNLGDTYNPSWKNRSNLRFITEYLMKISKKARILELKRRHLKINVLTTNTPYPSRKIR